MRSTPVTVPQDVQWPLRITWLAPDGSMIKKGDPVARFDDLELKERLANAQSERTVAQAKKEKEALLLRTAEQERQRATLAAQRELSMTQTFQRRDNEIFARDQIIESEIDERFQTAKVEHAQSSQTVDRKLARNKLGLIAVEGNKADEAIRRSEKGLAALEIRAPHDGVFTLRRGWMGETMRVGDTVFRSMSVAEISLVEKMEAEVFVLEAEAAGLAKGKKAEVIIEAQPGPPGRRRGQAGRDRGETPPAQVPDPVLRRDPEPGQHRQRGDEARATGARPAVLARGDVAGGAPARALRSRWLLDRAPP